MTAFGVYQQIPQGHEHSYVRNSAAAAITEAVETWPQSLLTSVSVLQDYYRDKVSSFLECCLLNKLTSVLGESTGSGI